MNIPISDTLGIKDSIDQVPGLPAPQAAESSQIYILFYIERPPHIYQKFFKFDGPFQKAIEKARKYCTDMNYRFIIVRPFISDLEEEVQRYAS